MATTTKIVHSWYTWRDHKSVRIDTSNHTVMHTALEGLWATHTYHYLLYSPYSHKCESNISTSTSAEKDQTTQCPYNAFSIPMRTTSLLLVLQLSLHSNANPVCSYGPSGCRLLKDHHMWIGSNLFNISSNALCLHYEGVPLFQQKPWRLPSPHTPPHPYPYSSLMYLLSSLFYSFPIEARSTPHASHWLMRGRKRPKMTATYCIEYPKVSSLSECRPITVAPKTTILKPT